MTEEQLRAKALELMYEGVSIYKITERMEEFICESEVDSNE